jgi:hypothetical protein
MVKYAIMATANLNDYLSPLSGNDRGTGIVDAARAISCFTEIPPDQADGKYENDWGNADAIAYLNGIFRIWAAGTVGRDARAEARLNKTFTPSRSMSETTFFFGFHDVGCMESDLGYAQFYATLKLWQGNTILASTEKEIHHVDWGGAYGANDYYTINITYQGTLLTGQQYKLEYGFYTFAHVAWSNFYDTPKNITALHLTAIDTVGAGNPNFEDRGGSVYWPWYWANNRAGRRELGGDCYPQSGDGTVDIFDLNTITNSYGSRPGQPKWNPNADLDGDNNVGLSDLIIVATDFGKVTNRKDGFYSWYTNVDGGGGNYTLAQWLCDHDVNNMKGKQVTFTFWFMPETVAPNGLQNYARAELYYITDTGSSQTINGAWVYPTQVKWYSASITTTTTLPANTKAIKVKIRGQPDFKAWIDKTSITIT